MAKDFVLEPQVDRHQCLESGSVTLRRLWSTNQCHR